jgi:hypothetical protein
VLQGAATIAVQLHVDARTTCRTQTRWHRLEERVEVVRGTAVHQTLISVSPNLLGKRRVIRRCRRHVRLIDPTAPRLD